VRYRKLLDAELGRAELDLQEEQRRKLALFCEELSRWNDKINLTSLSGAALVRRLVVEPAWIALHVPLGGSLIDIGSGNGSPAIPFRIVSSLQICRLVEARARRAAFLRHLAVQLDLPNTIVHRARFEDVAGTFDPPDWVSLQAVALTEKLLRAIQQIAKTTTTILWITTPAARGVVSPSATLVVPETGTQVFLYRLDLS
jgi:16S rRNA (guanine527-N7)-methyltransferase